MLHSCPSAGQSYPFRADARMQVDWMVRGWLTDVFQGWGVPYFWRVRLDCLDYS